MQWDIEGVSGTQRKVAINMDETVAFINGDDNIKFIVDKNQLTIAGEYRVVLRLYAFEFSDTLVYESKNTFKMVSEPYGGTLTIDKSQGDALVYKYSIKAESWESYDSRYDDILIYQFFYSDSNGDMIPIGE